MLVSKKATEQRQEVVAKVAQIKISRRIKRKLDQNKHDDYNTDELQDKQFNNEANPNQIKDLNIN